MKQILDRHTRAMLESVVPKVFCPVVVQLGPDDHDYTNLISARSRIRLIHGPLKDQLELPPPSVVKASENDDPGGTNPPDAVARCDGRVLPLPVDSVDLFLMAYSLDVSTHPHQLLRETIQVLRNDGHLILIGFNPFSTWGLRRLINRRRGEFPWNIHALSPTRVQDWFKLLDLEVMSARYALYDVPVANPGVRRRLQFLRKAGDRWWPSAGAVYCLLARKRSEGLMMIAKSSRLRSKLRPRLVTSVVRRNDQ